MSNVFHGFELLMLKTFSIHPSLWREWKQILRDHKLTDSGSFAVDDIMIPQSSWFLSMVLHKRLDYLLTLIHEQDKQLAQHEYIRSSESLLTQYMNLHCFTEFHLDSIFKYGEDNELPRELFKCCNVKYLSLKYNSLDRLPADIGRMSCLEHLALANNKLLVHSIPYSLTFCTSLRTLFLDNNLLDALPGFLLKMPSLVTVHRHGNHNYFKSTFMWYHTDVNFRIIPTSGTNESSAGGATTPESLQFWAAKAVVGEKHNFFADEGLATVIQDYVAHVYDAFNICDHCNRACLVYNSGYKVITFKNPYLGNTCVPFQHWACSVDCAKALEVPARLEQIATARFLDKRYEDYINVCQSSFATKHTPHSLFSCGSQSDYRTCPSRNKCTCSVM